MENQQTEVVKETDYLGATLESSGGLSKQKATN
jgi:hypothetical protein